MIAAPAMYDDASLLLSFALSLSFSLSRPRAPVKLVPFLSLSAYNTHANSNDNTVRRRWQQQKSATHEARAAAVSSAHQKFNTHKYPTPGRPTPTPPSSTAAEQRRRAWGRRGGGGVHHTPMAHSHSCRAHTHTHTHSPSTTACAGGVGGDARPRARDKNFRIPP